MPLRTSGRMSWRKTLIAALGAAAASGPVSSGAQSLTPGGSWSGPYWGLTGGGAWNDVKGTTGSADLIVSGHLGYGIQFSALYLGAEIDGTYGGTKSTSYLSPLYSSTLEIDWSATARARLGLAADGVLLYVTGGAAWSGQTLGIHGLGAAPAASSSVVAGTVLGAGVEMKLLPFVSARIEGLHTDYGSQGSRLRDALSAHLSSGSWMDPRAQETVIRAGLSIRFN